MYTYLVTVTPRYAMRAGSWQAGAYTVEVEADTRAKAIKQARREYEDAKVNPATFTARRAKR